MARVLITMPETARPGETVQVRTLIQHLMETGYRPDAEGAVVPRDILRRFSCRYDGEEVFAMELAPAIAANPLIGFAFVATHSGTVAFTWTGDNGFDHTETRAIRVE
jgi:sulfur-oxidizing protein SoxZ